ncbi:class I SAM-dependent methyltransferase [Sandaracinus amylolyticus]|uniref:N-methyltransferase, putative n=1 Tax=Sandaracinus amylolyticus TaxID=927083 RepID=A0A0F6YIH3_9BACT|nr:class I SAM-dependent methyltransferase [Sandaracinus amylolyticus]AKF06107.1 N-methyltransferase, putative [Sandaracinus amylolyticus]
MQPRLYDELVPWYRLIDPPADHAPEVASFVDAIERAARRPLETALELGAGAGNNAVHMKRRFRCTLSDVSAPMLALSRELNPECEHVLGDMRTLRLDRVFDAVLVHDAIMYMTSEADLAAAVRTAFVHTAPGGVAVFAPDVYRETFRDHTELLSEDLGARSMRGIEWTWDPDPSDDTFVTEYAFVLRDTSTNEVRAVHDRHVEGLFAQATWRRVLERAGYRVATFARPLDSESDTNEGAFDECFVCLRP